MSERKIFDYQVDETLDLFVLIKQAEVRIAKNGKKFIAFTFQDTSGQIDGKMWDASDEDIEAFQAGKVIHLNGKREIYQGNPQVKLFKLRLAKIDEPNQPAQFLQKAPIAMEEMKDYIQATVFEITQPSWNRLVRHLLNKYQKEFFSYPAAKKHHHAFYGGLVYHTYSMLRTGKHLVTVYPELNASLLYAGILLHDLGKTIELSGPMATEYTLEGNLVGHIVLVDEEIAQACETLKIDLQSEEMILLRHMILAHHGLLEYGSPVRPRIMEAEVLHQIDNLDASMQMMITALSHTQPGEYSDRIFGLENRSFYKTDLIMPKPEA